MRYQVQTRFTPPFLQGSSTNALSAADASFLLDKPTLIYTPLSSDKISSAEFLYIDHKHGLEKVYHHNELGIAIVYGVAWFWSCGKWESAPREQWAWKYVTAVDGDDMWQRLWAPVLLSSISIDYKPRKAQLSLPSPSSFNASDMSSGRAIAASWVFGLFRGEQNSQHWRWFDVFHDHNENRKLARVCRLVCRDWGRRLPLGDPMLKVAEGAVWYQTESDWKKIPKRYWAWMLGPLEWWAERCQQDSHARKERKRCKAWYPMLIRPIDDTMLSKGKDRSTMSLLVTKEYPRIRSEPSPIGRPFLEYVRDSDDRKLYRTCRLVCREWARQYPMSKPELYNFNFSDGMMRYWMADDWHPLPNKYWAWMIEDAEWWPWWAGQRFQTLPSQRLGGGGKGWHPKLVQDVDESILKWRFSPASATGSLEWGPGMDRLLLHRRNSSDTRIRDVPAAMKMIGSWTFGFICRSGPDLDLDRYWCSDERKLGRTCRLVCRDWARELPLGDPQLTVAEGAVWYHFEEGWQHLPKRYWAWTRQELEWWMEESQLDGPRWGDLSDWDRKKCKAWYPRLIRPVGDLMQSGSEDRSMTLSVATTAKPSRTHLEASIGQRFLENIHDLGDKVLYRTCRLVCRDWARQFPSRNPEQARLKYSGGVALYWAEKCWWVLPVTYWVWTFETVGWWTNGCHDHEWSAKHMRKPCWGKGWVMKLVQPLDDHIRQDLLMAPFPARRHRRTTSVASALPPELFKYICNAADYDSWSSRLVCRYWNEQCTPHIFPNINIKKSPKRIRALWQFSRGPKCRFMPHVKTVENVPNYDKDTSGFPWVHLLTQTSLSVGFAWQNGWNSGNTILIAGSFGGGHRTIRSIHFGLPRSLPRSFSRGIRILTLWSIRFNRFDDLANLVCELPDLDDLTCLDVHFTLIPTELAHRRPRRCRNNLRVVCLRRETADPTSEEQTAVPLPVLLVGLSLYLSVYDVASFFSANETAALIALMQPYRECDTIGYAYTQNSTSRKLILGLIEGEESCPFRLLLYSSQGTLKLGVAFNMTSILEKWKQAYRQRFDNMFPTLHSQMPSVPIHAIFGFDEREEMLEFAEALPSRMPAVAGETTLHYAMKRYNDPRGEGWYQASLDSEELRGEPKENLWEVYPIEDLDSEDLDSN